MCRHPQPLKQGGGWEAEGVATSSIQFVYILSLGRFLGPRSRTTQDADRYTILIEEKPVADPFHNTTCSGPVLLICHVFYYKQ